MEKHVFLRTMDWLSCKDSDNVDKGECIFEGFCCFRLLDKESRFLFFKRTSLSNDDSTQLNLKLFLDSTSQSMKVIAILDGIIYRVDISYISRIILCPGTGSSCTTPPYIEWLFPTVAFRYYSHNMESKEKLIHQLKSSINELMKSRCFDYRHMEKRQSKDRKNFLESLRAYMEGECQDLDWIST